jgi:hypothetical protein
MGIFITDAIPRKARVRLSAIGMVRMGLLLGVGGAMIPAAADNGPLYVAPGPSGLISADVAKRNQEQLAGTGRKLGDLLGSSLKSSASRATDLVVTTKCGHYLSATITYADGTAKTLNLSNAPASQSDMDKAKAAIPILRIVDQFGCDH